MATLLWGGGGGWRWGGGGGFVLNKPQIKLRQEQAEYFLRIQFNTLKFGLTLALKENRNMQQLIY